MDSLGGLSCFFCKIAIFMKTILRCWDIKAYTGMKNDKQNSSKEQTYLITCLGESTFQSNANIFWSLYFTLISGNNKTDKTNPAVKCHCPYFKIWSSLEI